VLFRSIRPTRFEAGTQELDDQPLIIPVANERRASIGFTVNQSASSRVDAEGLPPFGGGLQTTVPPRGVDARVGVAVQESQCDLRERAP
jgi:hypothetical protein